MRSLFSLLLLLPGGVLAIGQKSLVNFNSSGIMLASQDSFVTINADKNDFPAVLRVCDDLAMDFGRVTGANGSVVLHGDGAPTMNASMIFNVTGKPNFGITSNATQSGGAIIAGTIGHSSVIDNLVSQGRLNVAEIKGKWESYVSSVVQNPMPGVSQALVIAGMVVHLCGFGLKLTGRDQAPTVEGPFTVYTLSPSKSVFLLGGSWPTLRPRSTA